MVSPDDVRHLPAQSLAPEAAAGLPLIPYCFDFRAGTIIFAAGVDPARAMEAEFHYDYLRTHARSFVEMAPGGVRMPEDAGPAHSILLFSPGRCGSTLLAKVIRAMGSVSISEPDFYSQFAYHAARARRVIPAERQLLEVARQVLVAPWRNSPHPVVLKMRSHANIAPAALLPASAGRARVLFLMRHFEPWCASRLRAFGGSLDAHLKVYRRALQALRLLARHTDCLLLDYDDMNVSSLDWAQRLAAFLGLSFDEASIRQVLAQDSQQGTLLAAEQLPKQLPAESRDAIAAAWKAMAPSDLLAEVGLQHYSAA